MIINKKACMYICFCWEGTCDVMLAYIVRKVSRAHMFYTSGHISVKKMNFNVVSLPKKSTCRPFI